MMMMTGRIEDSRCVALRADGIALGTQHSGVRIVAIGAGDTGGVHAALDEGAPGVHLVALLPVGVIEAGLQQGGPEGIEPVVARVDIIGILAATRVAARTGLDFARFRPGRGADG
jgi:hypothetical protein